MQVFIAKLFLNAIQLHLFHICFLPLHCMKRRFAIFNLILMAVVLFTTAWHSFHAFSHEHHEVAHHHHLKKEVTHFSADDHEDCSTCDFHFDYFVAPQQFCLRLDISYQLIPYTFSSIEGSASFGGSLFALRAPPIV